MEFYLITTYTQALYKFRTKITTSYHTYVVSYSKSVFGIQILHVFSLILWNLAIPYCVLFSSELQDLKTRLVNGTKASVLCCSDINKGVDLVYEELVHSLENVII